MRTFIAMAFSLLISGTAFAAPSATPTPVPEDADFSYTKSTYTNGWALISIVHEFGDRGTSTVVLGKSQAAVYFNVYDSNNKVINKSRLGFSGADAAVKAESCARKFDLVAEKGGLFYFNVDKKGRNVMCANR